jgi:hypothetical protein
MCLVSWIRLRLSFLPRFSSSRGFIPCECRHPWFSSPWWLFFLQSVHAESSWIVEPEKNCGICENVILCPYCAPKLARKTSNSCKVIAIEEIHHRIKTPATAILPSAGCGMICWSHNAKRLQQLACRRKSEIYFQGLTVHHRGRVFQFTILWYQVSAVVLLLCLLLLLRIS